MGGEIGIRGELLLADAALKLFLLLFNVLVLGLNVSRQFFAFHKCTVTVGAYEWLVVGMDTNVLGEFGRVLTCH